MIRKVRNRLSLTDLLKRYPEIASIHIERPLIVVGMPPRSGTTHLVNLIAQDRRRRALPYWEAEDPIPTLGQGGPDVFGVDPPRYTRVKAEHEALMASTPYVAAMHDRFPPEPSRRKWNYSISTWPATFSNGMPVFRAGATSTSAWITSVTTVT